MKQSGVYCIRNTVSKRRYVGSTKDINGRWYSHRHLLIKGMHHSKTLLRSWIKHGESAFVFEILELVPDPSKLIEREQYWINEFNSACPKTGFNISPTAGNCIGCKHSAETRAKMSLARKGVPKSPEGRERIRAALLRRNLSPEMREKVRASKVKLYSTQKGLEQLSKQSLAMWERRRNEGLRLGHPQTEETRKKLSIAKTGKMSDAHKAAIAASNRNRKYSNRQLNFGSISRIPIQFQVCPFWVFIH